MQDLNRALCNKKMLDNKLKAKIRSFRFLGKFFYSVFKIKNYKILLAADEQKEKLNINSHLIS